MREFICYVLGNMAGYVMIAFIMTAFMTLSCLVFLKKLLKAYVLICGFNFILLCCGLVFGSALAVDIAWWIIIGGSFLCIVAAIVDTVIYAIWKTSIDKVWEASRNER